MGFELFRSGSRKMTVFGLGVLRGGSWANLRGTLCLCVAEALLAGDTEELLLLNLHRYFGLYGANLELNILPSSPQAGRMASLSPLSDLSL